MMTFIGLDLSLTGTGVGILSDDTFHGYAIRPPAGLRGTARLAFIEQRIIEAIEGVGTACVAVEGYAMNAKSRQFSLGELGGVARMALYRLGVQAVIVPPKTLKMIIAGNGNADKKTMIATVNQMLGFGVGEGDRSRPGDRIADDNVADGIALARLAQMRFGSGPAYTGVPAKFVKNIAELELLPVKRVRSRGR